MFIWNSNGIGRYALYVYPMLTVPLHEGVSIVNSFILWCQVGGMGLGCKSLLMVSGILVWNIPLDKHITWKMTTY